MIITRDDVLKAIREEPLIATDWIGWRTPENGGCPVCAVGAVLRHKGLDDLEIPYTAYTVTKGKFIASESIPAALAAKNYLGALSIKWERMTEMKKPSEWYFFQPKELDKFKPEFMRWILDNLPDGVIYSDDAELDDYYQAMADAYGEDYYNGDGDAD